MRPVRGVELRSHERSARSLFRHLDDPHILKTNPLVADYFREDALEDRSEADVLREIRANLLAAARLCHTRDVWSGRERRGSRTLAIITHLCNGRTPKQAASDLNISLPQFYRDRREAILCTTRVFLERRQVPKSVDTIGEVRRFQLFRIWSLIDQGLAAHAISEAKGLLQSADQVHDKIVALSEYGYAACQLGDLSTAKESCLSARALLRDCSNSPSVASLDLRVRCVEYTVASAAHDSESAYNLISKGALRAERLPLRTPEDNALALTFFLNLGHAAVLAGKLSEARQAVNSASEIVFKNDVPPGMASRVAFMRYFAEHHGASPVERQELLMTAAQAAQRGNSMVELLTAYVGLVDHYVAVGQEKKGREYAELAHQMAQAMDGDRIDAIVGDALVSALLRTSQSAYAVRLLTEVRFPSDDFYALRGATYEAQLLLRAGQNDTARQMLVECERQAEALGQPRTLALLLPDLALAQWRCGLEASARETALRALSAAESFGTAAMSRLTRQIIQPLVL